MYKFLSFNKFRNNTFKKFPVEFSNTIFNNIKFPFTKIKRGTKSLKFTKSEDSLNIEQDDMNKHNEDLFSFSNNIYLQIYSCLDKLNAFDDNNQENQGVKQKINDLLNKNKIDVKINDDQILKMITYKNKLKSENNEQINVQNDSNKDNKNEMMSYIEKIVQEEMSEEEYAEENETNIRFIRPPHNKDELKKVFQEAEKIYEEKRNILFYNDKDIKNSYKEKFIEKVPNYFVMRALSYPQTDTEIFLVGVQRNSNIHSLYLANLLENYKPDMIAVHMHPDLPLFIDTEEDFNKDWVRGITIKQESSYMVNPLPKSVNEVILSTNKIEKMIDYNFAYSDSISISPKIVFAPQKFLNIRKNSNVYADAYLSSFIYSFNSRVENFSPIAICDMPRLKILEELAYNTSIDEAKEVFNKIVEQMTIHNYSFNLEAFYEKIFLSEKVKRLDYTAELIRHMCFSNKKIVLITNHNFIDPMVAAWKNLSDKIKPLESFYTKGDYKNVYFPDFIEKLVILDLLTGSFIQEHFIKHQTFPYPPKPYDSWKEFYPSIMQIWSFHYIQYSQIINDLDFNQEIYNSFLEKFNLGFEDEVDEAQEEKESKEDFLSELNK